MQKTFEMLTQYIKESSNVIIMTHNHPDFDGFGSALCLHQIISSFNIACCIVGTDKVNESSVAKAYPMIEDLGINIKTNKFDVTDDTLLIVLDTHKISMCEKEELLEKVKNIIVIDHHIKSKEYIKNTLFSYINSNLSSTVEFVTKYLEYLNVNIDEIIATFMLVGLEVDTNSYNLKTSSNTHETASYLFNLGADNILKQIILKQSMEMYKKRHRIIEKSIMIDSFALCVADDLFYTKADIAIIAEELLQFENVEASFVIGRIDEKTVGISARSIGNVNVEVIMAKLDGGGHITEAATQLNCTIKEAERKLRKIIGG